MDKLSSIILERVAARASIMESGSQTLNLKMDSEFLAALVNGDTSGLSDEEAKKLAKWEASLPAGHKSYSADSDDLEEGIDGITGDFSSNLVHVTVTIRQ